MVTARDASDCTGAGRIEHFELLLDRWPHRWLLQSYRPPGRKLERWMLADPLKWRTHAFGCHAFVMHIEDARRRLAFDEPPIARFGGWPKPRWVFRAAWFLPPNLNLAPGGKGWEGAGASLRPIAPPQRT